MTRSEQFLVVVDVLQSGRNVELVGEFGSGRTHLLERVREHFIMMGWQVIEVTGIETFRNSPLVALSIAGVAGTLDARSSSHVGAYRALLDQVHQGRTIFIVDDSDSLDEASWGILTSLSSRAHVPMVVSRLKHRPPHQTTHPTSGFSSMFTLELQPMGYAELEKSLEELVQTKIEPGTMSRIFAKSGGTIGLAETIYSTALRGGRIVVEAEDGVARAVGTSLWLPALRAVADTILQPLHADDVVALKTLALLGPADLATAMKVVPVERILSLEERSFLTLVNAGPARLVTVNPPLLIEHFRHDGLPAQRTILLDEIDHSQVVETVSAPEEVGMRETAALIRLLHERARLRTLKAREGWRQRPSLRTATQFLAALEADNAHSIDEVNALFNDVRGLTGTESDRAEWEVVHAMHIASHHGQADEAVRLLHAAAEALPSEREALIARSLIIEMTFFAAPEKWPLDDVDISVLSLKSRQTVLYAHAHWYLQRGAPDKAAGLLETYDDWDASDPQVGALIIYTQIALGSYNFGYRIAIDRLRDARADLDASRIRVYAFLAAVSALFARRYDESEILVADASALGLPVGGAPSSYIGITVLSAYFAVRRGQRGLATQYLAELDSSGLRDGALPGLHRAFVYSRLALLEGDITAAARIRRESGDELWGRRCELAAGYEYLDGILLEPTQDAWDQVKDRIATITSPSIVHIAEFSEAFVRRDGQAMVDVLQTGINIGRAAESVHLARRAMTQLRAEESSDDAALSGLQAVIDAGGPIGAGTMSGAELTPREREVAELVASGMSNPMIAEALVVSTRTVESHINKLMKKIGAKRRQDIRDYLLAIGNRA
ncbi:helix-turn-helix transcriptional regulator [Leucobacter viscericola]|uniref:Helix-turn-helix transcriptional regulator n=1 Tax=Leucobacter viscericola TaxID=2714935 RepID=A0A6G7XG50_9MICO|nr:helix-turn-helix transcriptional regulator [Leucobacter viscericola]QIK63446.1 helix-turn-helix transcriptional regulator [Leucobacter viscericola]